MTTRHDDVTEDLPTEYEVEGWRVASRSTGADMSTPKERLDAFLSAGIGYMSRGRLDALRRDFDALLAEHRAEVEHLRTALTARRTKMNAAARDAALEEAAGLADDLPEEVTPATVATRIRALKSSPCAVLPVEKVREVLRAVRDEVDPNRDPDDAPSAWEEGRHDGCETIARRLGVDLDAKAGPVSAPPRKESERECTCTGSCRGADGLGFGWRCALQR
jgi:hypothetical protein